MIPMLLSLRTFSSLEYDSTENSPVGEHEEKEPKESKKKKKKKKEKKKKPKVTCEKRIKKNYR